MQAKNTAPKPLVSVYAEKGVLAFRFSSKYNPLFEILDGKTPAKQRTMGLGLRESPENWKLAQSAALRIERDLSDSENWQILFDPTFVKYGLAVKYSAAALKLAAPIPEIEPEMTVGAMWEEYLLWKQPQLQPTTFSAIYAGTYSNVINGLQWDNSKALMTTNGIRIYDLPVSESTADMVLAHPYATNKKHGTLSALSEAFCRLQSLGKTKLTINPFVATTSVSQSQNKTDMYKSTVNSDGDVREWWQIKDIEADAQESDRRAFTKQERDIIIKAFYESKKTTVRQLAPLVEFRFLTGCRSGEAFALRWCDVFMGRAKNNICFSKSYSGMLKNTQVTKTGESRIFKMYPKLRDLLLRIKPVDAKPNDLVFTKLNGKSWDTGAVAQSWCMQKAKNGNITYHYPGVVTQLATDGLIDSYLPFYNCRHTFITLMARAGTDLLLLATACGNSVEVIQRHYLGVDTEASFPDI